MSSDSEDSRRKSKKHKKQRHKHHKKHRHDRDSTNGDLDRATHYDSDSSNDSRNERKRKRIKKHKHSSRDKPRDDDDDDDDADSNSSGEERHKRRRHKRKHSSHRKESKRRHERREDKEAGSATTAAPSKCDSLVPQLHELLSDHPDLATELPYLLIRISSGASINLSQVPDPSVARGFRQIFQTLGCTDDGNDAWKFDDGGRLNNGGAVNDDRALVLVKLARYLLDEKGVTMDAIHDFEEGKSRHQPNTSSNSSAAKTQLQEAKKDVPPPPPLDISTEISSLTIMLLEKIQEDIITCKGILCHHEYDHGKGEHLFRWYTG